MDSAPGIPTSDTLDNGQVANQVGIVDPNTANLNTELNSYQVIATVPIMERGFRYGAPNPQFNLGWRQQFVNTNANSIPAYETQAPDPLTSYLSYQNLIIASANPPQTIVSRPPNSLRAPTINEGQ